jgi:chromosomal replication initiation ATPase DnaA
MKKINNPPHDLSYNQVMYEFAKRMGITPMQLIAPSKKQRISDVRQLYCKLRYDIHGLTFEELGEELGRAHTTVRYGVLRVNDLLRLNDKKTLAMWNRVRDISELPI